ncbi:MAG: hypothetical protein EDM03_10075 [Porphyrobacter sp. IPPAS B-1204]|nr:MAG: hypothetical protein EDM03_10075 [Porphyrobacter sp. IPPAS B-1204]
MIDIVVKQSDGRTVLGFSQVRGVVFRNPKVPCIRHVGIYEQGADRRANYVWSIRLDRDAQCVGLAAVEVGVVPMGWREVHPLKVMPGKTYFAEVHGIGWGETSVTF